MRTQIHLLSMLASVSCISACGSQPPGDDDPGTSSTTDAYPRNPDAPDALCAMDPARVYITEIVWESGALYLTLTDVDDPAVLCAFSDVSYGRLDPIDGEFVTLTPPRSRVYLRKAVNDWLRPTHQPDLPWVPSGLDNDMTIAEVLFAPGVTCHDQTFFEVVADSTTFYASCGGIYVNAPELKAEFLWPLVGLVDGRRIWAPLGYLTEPVGGNEVVDVPLPAGVDVIDHLAARPNDSGLLTALAVFRGDVMTLERAQVTPDGVTIIGSYAHDMEESGVAGISTYALAADGTLYGLGGVVTGDDEPGADTTVVRLPIDSPPEVVYEATIMHPEGLPRLTAVGAG